MQASRERPRPGTATGRVWEIADELSRRTGGRARRATVIDTYVKEGGNPNTAHTQFQKWRTAYEESRKRSSGQPRPVPVQVKEGGRIVLPAELRATLGIAEGDTLMAEVVDGELRLFTRAEAIRRVQEYVRGLVPEGTSLVDELIAERRQDAQREASE
jgi:AbrB family looped-hinge helix DNA binding protein